MALNRHIIAVSIEKPLMEGATYIREITLTFLPSICRYMMSPITFSKNETFKEVCPRYGCCGFFRAPRDI